ncbi:IS4 family transposase [Saccharopolyspora taberi]|uniref:Transposase IS4 N-terminal domain-containing protein n=1 Tax=Saccharopolyspora taberi TaxID=60895 RepID=A0ABN3VHJ3_9PSEU
MPRPGQRHPLSDESLPDRIAIGVLIRTFPPELVDAAVDCTGRTQLRSRLLPAQVVVYFVLAMCLFNQEGYESVTRRLTDGLEWARRGRTQPGEPTTAALSRARARLGPEPLKALFARACRLSTGPRYRGRRLVSLDSTTFDLPVTDSNLEHFGRPGNAGRNAYPQARVGVLAECGTNAVFAAETAPLRTPEKTVRRRLFSRLGPGMLLLAGRRPPDFDLWCPASATGADLLWRARHRTPLPVVERFDDGSYSSELITKCGDPVRVRVVETAAGRLVTTILRPDQAPAGELADLHDGLRKTENALEEVEALQGPDFVLRSRQPAGVEQELYGFLLVHHALRAVRT